MKNGACVPVPLRAGGGQAQRQLQGPLCSLSGRGALTQGTSRSRSRRGAGPEPPPPWLLGAFLPPSSPPTFNSCWFPASLLPPPPRGPLAEPWASVLGACVGTPTWQPEAHLLRGPRTFPSVSLLPGIPEEGPRDTQGFSNFSPSHP